MAAVVVWLTRLDNRDVKDSCDQLLRGVFFMTGDIGAGDGNRTHVTSLEG